MTDAAPYLSYQVTTEGRDVLVEYLREQAETAASGSRAFGRGFMHAVEVLSRAKVRCHSCNYPRRVGETVRCVNCGTYWRVSAMGASWLGPDTNRIDYWQDGGVGVLGSH
jgi:hypothetical protein